MTTHVYTIRALTNLHPGSGEAGYGVIDKEVQRDATTGYPTIHMSGIKGALRQFFEDNGHNALIKDLFGSEPGGDADKISRGKLRFISADLLAMPNPVASGVKAPYHLVQSEKQTSAWQAKASCFGPDLNKKINVDDWDTLSAEAFTELAKDLPVVARNYLDDGQSKNLWYEEFVPRESIFATLIQGDATYLNQLSGAIDGKVIQLGGNATVGYGYCLFTLKA